jgi:hypothetical protein
LIVFYLVSGSYSYTIGLISGYRTVDSGSYTVTSTAVTVITTFSKTTYTVKFDETGLTLSWKTSWCVTFDGQTKCATTGTISFTGVVNGTYGYGIGHLANYTLGAPYSGSVTVSGAGQGSVSNTVRVPWTLVKYLVTFTESGLPAHTSWEVTFNGVTVVKTTKMITFEISNGTYTFSASSNGYGANPSSGTITVDGAPTGQTIVFTANSDPAVAVATPVVRD